MQMCQNLFASRQITFNVIFCQTLLLQFIKYILPPHKYNHITNHISFFKNPDFISSVKKLQERVTYGP